MHSADQQINNQMHPMLIYHISLELLAADEYADG
jgi:hypothetical protein